jgi:iron complex transport system substrate-binding protein
LVGPRGGHLALVVAALLAVLSRPAAGGGPDRIVSLAPSITEIVYALGAGDRLVGVCGHCNHPAAARRLPRVGGFLSPSVEVVVAARPDLVLAVPSPGNREAVRALERTGLPVVVVADRTLADLWASIERIATVLGDPAAGPALVARVQAELAAVQASVAQRARARVLLVVGHRPLIVAGAGTLQDELVAIAGGRNVAADAGTTWPQLSMEVVIARRPDVILDSAMGTEAGGEALFASLLQAGDGGPRIVPMASDMLLRAGPRVGQAARALARAIHADLDTPALDTPALEP